MPISAIDDCPESHWADVLKILNESVEGAGFEGSLVSEAEDVGIIHKRIIQNLYDNPMVVCDVSGKNPNVMFELGLRLAFDKPTIIVKDDKTSYSFDTSAIEHLEYPRDLRFSRIVDFKKKLGEKVAATYKKATTDPSYTTFLKQFGEFTVAKLDKKEVSGQEYILEELRSLRRAVSRVEHPMIFSRDYDRLHSDIRPEADLDICLEGMTTDSSEDVLRFASMLPGVLTASLWGKGSDHKHLLVQLKPDTDRAATRSAILSNRKFKKLSREVAP